MAINDSDNFAQRLEKLILENEELKIQIQAKEHEINYYKQEILGLSHEMDVLLSQYSQDFELLKKLQKLVSPTDWPHFPGFEFSKKFVFGSKLGGDYLDIFEHADKLKFGVLVASSSGYAMSALLMSFIFKLNTIIEAKKGPLPDQVLGLLHSEINSDPSLTLNKGSAKGSLPPKQPIMKSSIFYGVFDRRNLSMSFCSAGRISGFLQLSDRQVHILTSDSEAIGLQTNPQLTTLNFELEPRSRLIIVTEGVLDVLENVEIAELLSQLQGHENVHDVRNEILFKCQQKSGLEVPMRDQTVVVIEVKDKVIKLAK